MVKPVILVTADDDHLLLREYESVLRDLRDEHPDADLGIHLAADLDHLPDLRTSSLFGGTTIVVIRNVDQMKAGSALKDDLEDYLAAPDPEAVLVLTAAGTGKIRKIATLAKDVGDVRSAGVPKPWDERGWRTLVGDEFRRLRRRADPGAVEAVLDRAGTNAAVISSHVSQICLAKPDVDTITATEVEDVIEGAGNHGAFAIADAALDRRDPAETIVLTRGMLADKADRSAEPVVILGMLISRARDLMAARGGMDLGEAKRRPDRGQKKASGVNPGMATRLQRTAGQWAVGELQWCHDRLAQADIDLKGNTDLPAQIVLELALLDVATRREPGAPWDPRATAPVSG